MTDKVQKIREEIERIKSVEYNSDTIGDDIACCALDMALDFINSLPEEPISEDLEEAAKRYVDERMAFLNPDVADMSCDRDTKMSFDVFDGSEVEAAFYEGAQWQKQQMIAKAVDIEVKIDTGGYPYIPQIELYDYCEDIPLAKEGDKYKVILIKED